MKKYNTDLQPLAAAIEYTGIGNPIDVADVLQAQQSLLTMINTLYGFGATDFWILDGITVDNSGNYTVSADGALVYLNGKFLYLPAGSTIVTGQCIINVEADGIPKGYMDLLPHNKYHLYTAAVGNTPNPPTTSPEFDGTLQSIDFHSISLNNVSQNPCIKVLLGYIITLQAQVLTLQNMASTVTHKKISIGIWNMQSTASLSVAHGLSAAQWKTISSIDVMILNDAANAMATLTYDVVTGSLAGHVDSIDAININMARTSGAVYDSSGYSGSSNRGYILIHFIA